MNKEDCIFCKIAQGKIPCEKVFQSENFFVIKDANPKTKFHSLVIPTRHYTTFLDMPSSLFSEFLETTKEAVFRILKQTGAEGFNLIMNNFEIAGQKIEHAHLHILPRYKEDGFKVSV
jgi:histidine triad (HIT) family protein